MKIRIMLVSICLFAGLSGCNQQANENAQPQIGKSEGQVITASDRRNMGSQNETYAQPYSHNYQGSYSGAQNTSYTEEVRSAQQVAGRATNAAQTVKGVKRAVSVAQGMDIVVAIETRNEGARKAIEQKVRQVIMNEEDGYNVYVSTDSEINERIYRLFSNMNNVKTSFVTPGISEIIYEIGQANGHQ